MSLFSELDSSTTTSTSSTTSSFTSSSFTSTPIHTSSFPLSSAGFPSAASTVSDGTIILMSIDTTTQATTEATPVVASIPTSHNKPEPKPKTAAIAGGVVGGISLLCLALICIRWYRRHKSNFTGNKFRGVSMYTVHPVESKNIYDANHGNGTWGDGSATRGFSNRMAHSDMFAETNITGPPPDHPGTASNGIADVSPDPSSLTYGVPTQTEGQIPHMKDESNTLQAFSPQPVLEIISPSSAEGVLSPNSLVPAVSLMIQEIESLRARLAQVEQRQPREATSLALNASDIDEDDRRTAPPAYSDDGRS